MTIMLNTKAFAVVEGMCAPAKPAGEEGARSVSR
jgi:hypothetical protein